MKQRHPKSHRLTEANQRKTQAIIEAYYGKEDLRRTWELSSSDMQIRNHGYLLKLRARIRNTKNYIAHRASPDSDI